MLILKNLHAGINEKKILKGLDLQIKKGEVHAIMGPNGSGKSTLAKVLAGDPNVQVSQGTAEYQGKNLFALDTTTRALEGIFLAFQYPVEIPGVNNAHFLRMAYNAKQKYLGKKEIDPLQFQTLLKEKLAVVSMPDNFLTRSLNEGFSGGEKKRNEILQMAVLEPSLAILDETDSGLDIDALRQVAGGVNALRNSENGILVITHYQRLLDYIEPDFVHILCGGRILRSGDKNLALKLEKEGYECIEGCIKNAADH